MPTPQQSANLVYKTSINLAEIEKAFIDFKKICDTYARFNITEQSNPKLFEEKRDSMALLIRLGVKYRVLSYLQGYRQDQYDLLMAFTKAGMEQSEKGGFAKTGELCQNIRTYILSIHEVATRAVSLVSRLRDMDGVLTATVDELGEAKEKFLKTVDELETSLPDTSPFPDDVKMPVIKADLIRNFQEEVAWIEKQIGAMRLANAELFIKEYTTPISELEGLPRAILAPSPMGMDTASLITVLSTPFPTEALFSVRSYGENVNKTFRMVSADLFVKGSDDECTEMFTLLKIPDIHLIITDINRVKAERLPHLYKQILNFASPNNLVFIIDTVGDRKVYDDFNRLADSVKGMSALAVSYTYLKMPLFAEVLTVFETNHLVETMTNAIKEQIRRGMPFMGYVGLSQCVYEHTKGHDPFVVGEEISETNRRTALLYLSHLVAPYQLIDNEWGDFSEGVQKRDGVRKAFDYDIIRTVNPENVRIILQKSGLSLFERCALATKYCTLGGDDVSIWADLPREEKEIRMQEASSVLCAILNTEYTPKVEVYSEETWQERGYHKNVAGFCSAGGKLIVYRERSIKGYDFALHIICHECFHAFQHTATHSPYSQWYFDEMGITRGRIAQWAKNDACYSEVGDVNSIGYKVEIIECDANAFADDCHIHAKSRWHEIEFV